MKVEVEKRLISDDNKVFKIGQDICFTNQFDSKRYIGNIVDFTEYNLILNNVECRGVENSEYIATKIVGSLIIKLEDINECNYVCAE